MEELEKYKDTVLKYDYSYGTGISAVVDERISMELNEYGEYKPVLDETKEVTKDSVPLSKVEQMMDESPNETEVARELYADVPGIMFNPRLGYYKDLYAGHVEEDDYRMNASSGGIGTWILKELFERDLIDGVIHVKENTDPENPVLFKYDISRSIEEIKNGAKTKYYPVELSNVIKTIKENPGRYAIIGLPAYIFSIRLLSLQDPIIKERIRFAIGLVCGHLKSAQFADSLAWQLGIKPGSIQNIDFRKKIMDRPAHRYGVEVTGEIDGKIQTVLKPMKELVGDNWGQGFFKVNASDYTDDVMNETADMTIGDAWLPQYTADSKGSNIVLIRHPEISTIITEGMKSGKLNMDGLDEDTMIRSQASHYRHTQDELGYRLWKKDKVKEWRPKKRIEASKKIPYFRKKIQDQRAIIAKMSHIYFKNAVEKDDLNYFIDKMKPLIDKYEKLYSYAYYYDQGIQGLAKKVFKKL